MKHSQIKTLTYIASIGTLISVVFMSAALLFPGPIVLVLAMSAGQGIGILALSLFLLAIALDLNLAEALADNAAEDAQQLADDQSHRQ